MSSTPVARDSLINSTQTRLLTNQTFTGVSDAIGNFTKVNVAVMANVEITLKIYQGINGVSWDKVNVYTIPATPAPAPNIAFQCPKVQTALEHRYFYITAKNTDVVDASFTRIHSQVFNDGYLDRANDSVMVYGEDGGASAHPLLTDASGSLIISNESEIVVSGDVNVLSAPHLSYLTDNVAVATLPPITGDVNVLSAPHLSYLTDNVAVATLPAITGSVSVTSAPYLSYLTSNIAVATQPALAFSTDKVDATGSSVSVTGSVAVTNADITSIKTNTARFGLAIGSNYAETIINTFTNLSITGGYLYNLSVYSDGASGTNFLKVYGVAGATNADTPLLIVPVTHATSVNLALSGLKALTGISVRATANYAVADNNAPSNGISCNLTFSPLV